MKWLLLLFLVCLLVVAELDYRAHSEPNWDCYTTDDFVAFRACGRTKETTGKNVGKLIVVRKTIIGMVTTSPRKDCTQIESLAGHAVFVEGHIEWVLHRLQKDARLERQCFPQ